MFIWEVKRFCSLRSHRSLHLVSKLTRDVVFLTTTKLLMEALQRKLVFICDTMVIIIVFYLMQSMRSPNFQLSPICLLPSQHSVVVRIIETKKEVCSRRLRVENGCGGPQLQQPGALRPLSLATELAYNSKTYRSQTTGRNDFLFKEEK